MHIQTKFFGEIDVHSEQLWSFPKGLPGFEENKEFALLSIEGNTTFQVLQSTINSDIALIVANPYELVENYSIDLDDSTVELLKIEKEEDVFILAVLSIKNPFETSTINLQAPIVFQSKNLIAKQMITNNYSFSIRHMIGSPIKSNLGED